MRRCDELAISRPVPQNGGTFAVFSCCLAGSSLLEERKMPVLFLWAVPAVLVVGGGIYLIGHMH